MSGTYATALIVGFLLLLLWAGAVALNESGAIEFDPDERFGGAGRGVVATLVGFGMAGLSATYGGWPAVAAGAAAMAGAGLAATYAFRVGAREE
ncbi:MAG: hypothetical protein OEP52_06025 [Acidimicrobiia bacterium]|nr:hypothetical protein [Acidimicrobiia bacterium]